MAKKLRLVVIESPFAGNTKEETQRNITYGRRCLNDCLHNHGDNPYASHLFFTQEGVLNDKIPEERYLGMEAGFQWGGLCRSNHCLPGLRNFRRDGKRNKKGGREGKKG